MPDFWKGDPVFYFLAGSSALKFAVWYFLEKKQWRLVGRVSALHLYPIKSARGINLSEGHCTKSGIMVDEMLRDRHWLVVTSNNTFITGREEPTLTLVQPSFHGTTMHLDAPGMDTLTFQMDLSGTCNIVETVVWGDRVNGLDCGPQVSAWISKYLGKGGHKLIYCGPSIRQRHLIEGTDKWNKRTAVGDQVAYHDFSPFMIMSEATVADVKGKVPARLSFSVDRFRPNIVISGCDAYAEDNWNKVRIGNVQLTYIKLCDRCMFTTVDPDTGKKDPHFEPIKTLRSYRLLVPEYGESPCLGVNLTLDTPGVIHVGDAVYAIQHVPGFEY